MNDLKDSAEGIDVCLYCFNGGCLDKTRHHALTHILKSGHRFTLNVKRKEKQNDSGRVWRSYANSLNFIDLKCREKMDNLP